MSLGDCINSCDVIPGRVRSTRARNPQPRFGGYGFRARHLRWRPGMTMMRSARNLLDARNQFVDSFLNRHLLVDDAIHCLGPDGFVVENGEFVVLRELERHSAARILVVYRFAVAVLGPERPVLRSLHHWVPAAERAFYIG